MIWEFVSFWVMSQATVLYTVLMHNNVPLITGVCKKPLLFMHSSFLPDSGIYSRCGGGLQSLRSAFSLLLLLLWFAVFEECFLTVTAVALVCSL